MIKQFGAFIFASFLFCQSANGMFRGWFGGNENKEKSTPKIVSLLEDANNLPAGKEFKSFMKTKANAPLSYGFLCHLVKQKPDMMEKKFCYAIEDVGFFGIGKAFSLTARLFRLPGLMVDGMLNEEKPVTDIFRRVCGKKKEKKEPISIKEMLELELKNKSIDRKLLASAVGRFTAGTMLQCILDNQKKIPEIIIKEMVIGKKKGPKELEEEETSKSEGSDEKSSGGSYKALIWAVKKILNKCVDDDKLGLKTFFGEVAPLVYALKKKEDKKK